MFNQNNIKDELFFHYFEIGKVINKKCKTNRTKGSKKHGRSKSNWWTNIRRRKECLH